jgi:hypothetical protein
MNLQKVRTENVPEYFPSNSFWSFFQRPLAFLLSGIMTFLDDDMTVIWRVIINFKYSGKLIGE